MILRQSGPGGGSALQYFYPTPGVTSDSDLAGPGSSLNTVTFCYGLPAGPPPEQPAALAPCPLTGDDHLNFCAALDATSEVTGDAFVAFFFNESENFLEPGVCTCNFNNENQDDFNNGLQQCSFDVNSENYCFKENGQFSTIKAFRGVDAYCTTDGSGEIDECSTFCLRGFPSGTSYSCAK